MNDREQALGTVARRRDGALGIADTRGLEDLGTQRRSVIGSR
jgi:hypothetical protein